MIYKDLFRKVDLVLGITAGINGTFCTYPCQTQCLCYCQFARRGAQNDRALRCHFDERPALAAAIVRERQLTGFFQIGSNNSLIGIR